MKDLVENLARVQERLVEAALRGGREPSDVTLVAVTKTHPPDTIMAAYEAGVRHFGENRVLEGAGKIPVVAAALSGPPPIWHMVGHVQSRKTPAVVAHFDCVDSVDRLKVARRLSHFAQDAGRILPVLLECNVSGEETKYGFDLQDWERNEARREAFFAVVEEILTLPGLSVQEWVGLWAASVVMAHGDWAVQPWLPDSTSSARMGHSGSR